MKLLSDKVALVTGAGRGLGRAVVEALAREGCDVLAVVRAPRADDWLVEVAALTGRRLVPCAVDLRAPEGATAAVGAAVSAFGRLDILVNHAGGGKHGDFFDLTDGDWEAAFALKLFGSVRLTRAAWPLLKASKGAVVNITGASARTPQMGQEICASLNAGLLALTKSLAAKGTQDGVRVNAVNPGLVIEGDGLRRVVESMGPPDEAARLGMAQVLGTARFGAPEDIAHVVAFLASARAAYVQGAVVNVDGGRTRGF